MGPTNNNVSEILLDKVADWLMRTSLSDETLETIARVLRTTGGGGPAADARPPVLLDAAPAL